MTAKQETNHAFARSRSNATLAVNQSIVPVECGKVGL